MGAGGYDPFTDANLAGTLAAIHAAVTGPTAAAALAHRQGDWGRVVDLLTESTPATLWSE